MNFLAWERIQGSIMWYNSVRVIIVAALLGAVGLIAFFFFQNDEYIKTGDIVERIDSEYKLRRLELSEAINEIINSESAKELAQNINRFAKDFSETS